MRTCLLCRVPLETAERAERAAITDFPICIHARDHVSCADVSHPLLALHTFDLLTSAISCIVQPLCAVTASLAGEAGLLLFSAYTLPPIGGNRLYAVLLLAAPLRSRT
jgi:hypothetical protein